MVVLLLVTVAASGAGVGRTIGGHAEGANVCEGKPLTILSHNTSAHATGGVLNYFWQTSFCPSKKQNTSRDPAPRGIVNLPNEPALLPFWVDYFVDGEASPSVSMQPLMMAAQGFPDLMSPQNMRWDANGLFGRNTVSTTFHRIKVPFASSIHVQARWAGRAGTCHESYFNVRGTERTGGGSLVTLPGYGPLPAAARLTLQRIDNVTFQPFAFAPLFSAPVGMEGAIFLTALSLSAPAFQHPGWPHHTPPVPKSPGNHCKQRPTPPPPPPLDATTTCACWLTNLALVYRLQTWKAVSTFTATTPRRTLGWSSALAPRITSTVRTALVIHGARCRTPRPRAI